ncbi:MAG: hypothetical protein PHT44_01895 [Candidatus Portnoybacteria bacterium]|nr:hypothetical protein [Candidatus Portnoybacteria bacterium]MDD4982654.1 hypothetical protein [Candidatus Portnoybacteria bacterium]
MDNKIINELKNLNEVVKDLFIFLMCREGFGQKEIRTVFGKIDCARITKIASGIKKVAAQKIKNDKKK